MWIGDAAKEHEDRVCIFAAFGVYSTESAMKQSH
jgi:hypothetical protein